MTEDTFGSPIRPATPLAQLEGLLGHAQVVLAELRAEASPPRACWVGFDAANYGWKEFHSEEDAVAWQFATSHPEEGRSGFRAIHQMGSVIANG